MSDVETYTTDRVTDADSEAQPVVETTDLQEREVARDVGGPTVGGDENLAALNALNPVTPPPIPQTRASQGRWAGVSFEPVAGGNAVVAEQAVAIGGADPADAIREYVTVARSVADGDTVDSGAVEDPELEPVTGELAYDPTEDLERHRVLQDKLAVGPAGAPEATDAADADGDGQSNDDNVPIDSQG